MGISREDVGCWIVKCNPAVWDWFSGRAPAAGSVEECESRWSLSALSRRPALIRRGDLVALWITGTKSPGIHEFGAVTSDGALDWPGGFDDGYGVDRDKASAPCLGIEFTAARLGAGLHVPRDIIRDTDGLRGCEQLRAPRMSNPSHLTRTETTALRGLLEQRAGADVLGRVGW